ncbi:FAD-binding oxidoreductase [Acinetobacter radioresistens]|uniref:FAD-binding oxidoreductase n=1 Tax=Acinetobacter radioresistens TaxID=40216 RepID=UPI002AF6C74C|nr:FAD-binding oxidoreductase [Acinetobacter radioresistens]
MQVTSWGRLSYLPHEVEFLQSVQQVSQQISTEVHNSSLAFGMGKSYGDVCLNPQGRLLLTTGLDHFISFDSQNGLLECEAGVLLNHIHEVVVPQGWMLPVSPGTQLITVGGAIANDIHGKNHHLYGTFGEHIVELKLARTDKSILLCSPNQNPELFRATIGGIGLTGIILSAKIQLRQVTSPFLAVENIAFEGLSEFVQLASLAEQDWEYTVAWIDCLSGKNTRGIFMRAKHIATSQERVLKKATTISFPVTPPFSLINTLSLKVFNQYYYIKNKSSVKKIQHFTDFQYPLDGLLNWNRLYGKQGFYQYQCVIPAAQGVEPLEELLHIIQQQQQGSFLVVLKEFTERAPAGMLSFPMTGLTLALDFPNLGEKTLALLNSLDAVVQAARGRLYLAKDARMSPAFFRESYPRVHEFLSYKDAGISSAMSQRLMGV